MPLLVGGGVIAAALLLANSGSGGSGGGSSSSKDSTGTLPDIAPSQFALRFASLAKQAVGNPIKDEKIATAVGKLFAQALLDVGTPAAAVAAVTQQNLTNRGLAVAIDSLADAQGSPKSEIPDTAILRIKAETINSPLLPLDVAAAAFLPGSLLVLDDECPIARSIVIATTEPDANGVLEAVVYEKLQDFDKPDTGIVPELRTISIKDVGSVAAVESGASMLCVIMLTFAKPSSLPKV